MRVVGAADLTLRFLLELAALTALGFWGAQAGSGTVLHVVLAVTAPLAAAVTWGAFVAPKRLVQVRESTRLAVELCVFAAATAGLVAAGRPRLAAVLAVLAVADGALVRLPALAQWTRPPTGSGDVS